MRPLGLKILQHQSSSCLGRLGLAPAEDKCDTTIGVVVDEVLLMIVGHELHGEALGIGEVLVDRRNHVSNETDDHRVGDVVKGLMIVVLEGRLVSITAENIDTIVDAQLKELHECRLGCAQALVGGIMMDVEDCHIHLTHACTVNPSFSLTAHAV